MQALCLCYGREMCFYTKDGACFAITGLTRCTCAHVSDASERVELLEG